MCGIIGRINFNLKPISRVLLEKSCNAIQHRGPDYTGVYIDKYVGLGHLRLSIIDLSSAGNQPMKNEDGSIIIVFNGEIYNFSELRSQLVSKGHIFSSNTDTEVVVHLYEEYGVDCLNFLRGMFAFAIWDNTKQQLFVARDRFGQKPVYYHYEDNSIVFSSELKGLLTLTGNKHDINNRALQLYNRFNYIPNPLTIYENIFKLEPASYLLLNKGNLIKKKYWEIDFTNQMIVNGKKDVHRIEEELIHKLDEAIRIRMISDVPLGAFLSGGVDSSAVVAFASKYSSNLKTFSIKFEEDAYDESKYARIIANKFKTDHHEFTVKPDALDIVENLVNHYGEPFADSSAIPTYYVSKYAREKVTVALSGDGGDELFGGYPRYSAMLGAEKFQRIPFVGRALNHDCVEAMGYNRDKYNTPLSRLSRIAFNMSTNETRRYLNWNSWHHENKLYSREFLDTIDINNDMKWLEKKMNFDVKMSSADRAMYTDMMMYLPDDLLVKTDIASMANSLELRSPFLDHELAEFAARIPASLKLKMNSTKHILKKALEGTVPKEVMYREKMGFGIPLDKWFRKELKEVVYNLLGDSKLLSTGLYNKSYIERLIAEHMQYKKDNRFEIWNLVVLEQWLNNTNTNGL